MSKNGWKVRFARSGEKDLEKLDRKLQQTISARLFSLKELENPFTHKDIRLLEGKLRGYFRFRIGEYRAIIDFDPDIKSITVLSVLPRGRAYRN